jgi:hypothetical protein
MYPTPLEHNRRITAAITLVVGEGGHRFFADLGWEAMNRFIQSIG